MVMIPKIKKISQIIKGCHGELVEPFCFALNPFDKLRVTDQGSVSMRMMHRTAFALTAKPVIKIMCTDDQQHSRYNEEGFVRKKKLFGHQECKPSREDPYRQQVPMMRFIPVNERINPDTEGKSDHAPFKENIMDDINAEQRETGHQQWKHHAVYSTGHGGGNAQVIPIDFPAHEHTKLEKKLSFATILQKLNRSAFY